MKGWGAALTACVGIAAIAATASVQPAIRIVYNASDSAPRGWYKVQALDDPAVGDFVVVRLPASIAAFAAGRGYLPRSVPLLKRIVAGSGQHVCVRDGVVLIDGAAAARLLSTDRQGRPLPAWRHCRRLLSGELFLLNALVDASFDSRYFGPIDVSFVRGRAVPLRTVAER